MWLGIVILCAANVGGVQGRNECVSFERFLAVGSLQCHAHAKNVIEKNRDVYGTWGKWAVKCVYAGEMI